MNMILLSLMRLLGLHINLLFEIEFKNLFMRTVDYKDIVFKH